MLDKVNRVVKYMVFSYLVLFVGWGLIAPMFSIFVLDKIEGATLITVGIASAVYWVSRAVVQPFVARILDRQKGERDDYFALLGSLIGIGIAAFWIALVNTELMLYVAQAFHGAALGVYSVAWPAIFTRHMDKGEVAFDWSLDRGSIGLAVAAASIAGAQVAEVMGFEMVFVLAGIGSIASAFILMIIPKLIFPTSFKGDQGIENLRAHRKHKSHSTVGV